MCDESQSQESAHRPSLRTPAFRALSEEEAAAIRGGDWGAGTCVGGGFACREGGGFHWGICALVGWTSGDMRRRVPPESEKERHFSWGAGTCALVGYACWEKGGIVIGICAIVGGWV